MPGLGPGDLVTATRVVDERGETVWEGEPLLPGLARPVLLCAVARVVDEPAARLALAERTGAAVADMESGRLAARGRLRGVVRAVSDTADDPVGRLGRVATPPGGVAWWRLGAAFLLEPRRAARAAANGRSALAALERAAARLTSA